MTAPSEDLIAQANHLVGRTDWRPGPFSILATSAQQGVVTDPEGHTWIDLTSDNGRRLHGGMPNTVADAIATAARDGTPSALCAAVGIPVARRLARTFDAQRVALFPSADQALRAAIARANEATGRARVLVLVDDPDEGVRAPLADGARIQATSPDATRERLDSAAAHGEIAAVVATATTDLGWLRSWCDGAGCWLLADATRTALRIEPDPQPTQHAQLCILGPTLAGGLEIGAVLGSAEHWPSTEPQLDGDPLALAAAAAMLDGAETTRPAATIAVIGERLRSAFQAGCEEHDLNAELAGPPGRMALRFEEQDHADGPRIRAAFLEELARAGCLGGWVFYPPADLPEPSIQRAEQSLRDACSRIRTLLIEHNSYLSGGLRWPFPEPESMVGQRGLAIYRFPGHGGVDVTAAGDAARIAFAAGELGAVTSSGFFIPTLVRGDFEVTTRYQLETWDPLGHAACLGLFAQDQGSLVRYYAQHRSTDTTDHHVMASLCGQLFEEFPVAQTSGELRITRTGNVVRAWHRLGPTDEWRLLGEHPQDPERDMILGAKIWCGGRCDGLVASVTDLRIQGEIPVDQIPLPAIREDPRSMETPGS